jgi:hypothetical protein
VAVVISHVTYARTMKVDYPRFSWGELHGKHVVASWKGKMGTVPAFALGPMKTKRNHFVMYLYDCLTIRINKQISNLNLAFV